MSGTRRIEETIRRKEAEVADLEHRLEVARESLRAWREALQMFIRENAGGTTKDSLRAGSQVAKAHNFLQHKGAPQHISAIMEASGKSNNPKNRAALAGQISFYVRNQQVFTRPAPNTFGLIEWGHDGPPKPLTTEGPHEQEA